MQPVSLMFRMSGVLTRPLLEFMRDHTEHFALGESDAIRQGRTDRQLAEASLVLWDDHADLIVDFLPGAFTSTT